jgi:DNA-binding PadR family transcriptional regulator
MRESTYFTLAALIDGPLHGYGVMKRVAQLSDGRVRLAAGTLYTALERLSMDGLVTDAGEEIVDGRARRYYRLTGAGREAVDAHAAWLARSASIVRRSRRSGQEPA